jgi:hypothetical protein
LRTLDSVTLSTYQDRQNICMKPSIFATMLLNKTAF